MNAFETICLFLGLGLGAGVLYKGFHAGWWTLTIKQPIDVRMDEQLARDYRRIAPKDRVLRADFTRNR